MKFAVEAWAPEYGQPMGVDERDATEAKVDVTIEVPVTSWAPLAARAGTVEPESILFTDGVRRVDASVWVDDEDGRSTLGICASYAAGGALCDGRARVVASEIERGLFTCAGGAEAIATRHAVYPIRRPESDSPDHLSLALQARMTHLEVDLSKGVEADLKIVDGPLGARKGLKDTVGYVKTHRVGYLPDRVADTVVRLGPCERTPVFLIAGAWSRFSWYLRLPGGAGQAWAGVVRCETTGDLESSEAVRLADVTVSVLPRFASALHKDPRAPQNLYPIGGLERELRRLLGDAALLYRDLRVAAAINGHSGPRSDDVS